MGNDPPKMLYFFSTTPKEIKLKETDSTGKESFKNILRSSET